MGLFYGQPALHSAGCCLWVFATSQSMYSATFIFAKKQYDAEFDRLDAAIMSAAASDPDFAGQDTWENTAKGQTCVVYYWHKLDGLQRLMQHPDHLTAKRHYQTWYQGYHVIVAEVLKSYGDGAFAHPVPPGMGR